jgi:hypothetical protein
MGSLFRFDYLYSAGIEVCEVAEGWRVTCSDYVANEWSEVYPSLALALLRVANLVACIDADSDGLFASDSAEFVLVGTKFLGGQVIIP